MGSSSVTAVGPGAAGARVESDGESADHLATLPRSARLSQDTVGEAADLLVQVPGASEERLERRSSRPLFTRGSALCTGPLVEPSLIWKLVVTYPADRPASAATR